MSISRAQHRKHQHRQAGMSLLTVLVAVGILGIIAVAMSRIFSVQSQSQKDLDQRIANMAIIRTLNVRLPEYCPSAGPLSWVPNSCGGPPAGTYIAVTTDSGTDLIKLFNPSSPQGAQRMGDLYLRAKCVADPTRTLKIEAVNAKLLDRQPNTAWQDISPQIPLPCDIDR